jgi:hypothetical protein
VLDANGQPFRHQALRSLPPDKTQTDLYVKEQAAAARPAPERNNSNTGRRERWDPATGDWVDIGPAVNTGVVRTPGQEADDAKKVREEAERARNRAAPIDPADETDEQRRKRAQDRIDQQGRDAEAARQRARQEEADQRARDAANKPGAPTLKDDGSGGTNVIQTMPNGDVKVTHRPDIKSNVPPPPQINVNGQVWERDPSTNSWVPAKNLPTLGQATANVPPMPQLMPQAVTQALIQYHADLAKNPNLTPEQRVKAFDDFRQIANMAITQWTNEQNERESVRHDQYNRANATVTAQYNGMQQALGFVDKISGTVTAESGLAGKAFVALLGINAINLATSGLQSPPSVKAPTLGPGDLSNAAALEAKRQEVLAASQAAQAAAAPALPEPVFRPPPPVTGSVAIPDAGAAPPTPGEPGGPPLQPGPVWTPPASGGGEPSRANVPNQAPAAGNERPDDVITLRLPNGTLQKVTRTDYDAGLRQGLWRADWVVNAESSSAAQPTTTVTPPPTLPAPTSGTGIAPYQAAPSVVPEPNPYGGPGMSVRPDPSMPVPIPYPTSPGLQSRLSPALPDYAVLGTGPTGPLPSGLSAPASPVADYAVMGGGSADLHQQAAATVPWRMTPEQLEAYRRAGVPEDAILAVPGGY